MAELAKRTGVPRETIHFYLREGLLPRPRKGGRTVAYYDETHVERLLAIRRLREEKYLPLAVIKRMLDAPTAEQDISTLAEVLHMLPLPPPGQPAPSEEAARETAARGLLGPGRTHARPGGDASEQRIVALVEETLQLDPRARSLTLDDLQACATALTGLVEREAELFFDMVFETSDIAGTIAALRAGRGTVARFIAAYRDVMLRRIVEDLLSAIQHGPDAVQKGGTLPLSAHAERALGALDDRAALREAIGRGQGDAAARLAWHLFGCAAVAELAALPPAVVQTAGLRCAVLVAWGAYEAAPGGATLRALEHAADRVPDFALAQLLFGEAVLTRGARRPAEDGGMMERAVPALHRLLAASPDSDPEPAACVVGWYLRGRVEVALPAVLGRNARGVRALARALSLIDDPTQELEPVLRARIAANAHLLLGRHFAVSDAARARRELDAALAIDPEGQIADAVREELASRGSLGQLQ